MLTYSSIPRTFAHCPAETCPRKNECLRWKAFELLPENSPEQIVMINPKSVPPQGVECPYFLKMELHRYAKGMKQIFDKIPYNQAVALRREMIDRFGKSGYYRRVNGAKLISPKDQALIKTIFSTNGLPDDVPFDEYVESYLFY